MTQGSHGLFAVAQVTGVADNDGNNWSALLFEWDKLEFSFTPLAARVFHEENLLQKSHQLLLADYPKVMADLKVAGILPASVELRQVKDLNNLIEQVDELQSFCNTTR